MNEVYLAGNLTKDFNLAQTKSGKSYATNSVAINKVIDGNKSTTFVDFTCWGKTAELAAQNYKKGEPFVFTGELMNQEWEKDGKKYSKLAIWVKSIVFTKFISTNSSAPTSQQPAQRTASRVAPRNTRPVLRSAPQQQDGEPAESTDYSQNNASNFNDEDIPF
jgi:single-strand DNA-binding protein